MKTVVLLIEVYVVVVLLATVAWTTMRCIQKRRVLRRYRERHMTPDWRKRCL